MPPLVGAVLHDLQLPEREVHRFLIAGMALNEEHPTALLVSPVKLDVLERLNTPRVVCCRKGSCKSWSLQSNADPSAIDLASILAPK